MERTAAGRKRFEYLANLAGALHARWADSLLRNVNRRSGRQSLYLPLQCPDGKSNGLFVVAHTEPDDGERRHYVNWNDHPEWACTGRRHRGAAFEQQPDYRECAR